MASASPLRPHMDERGFLFVLPRLGMPDPKGEWHTVKAAIGKKRDIVDLVVNPSIPTPVHSVQPFSDMAPVGVDIGGVLWVLMLLKPSNTSPTASPEFFSIGAKRGPAAGVNLAQVKLPAITEWVFVPMSWYEEQMAAVGLAPRQRGQRQDDIPTISGGTAESVKEWKAYVERAKRDVTNKEAREGDILDADWSVPTLRKTLMELAKRGDFSNAHTEELKISIKIHPAPDGDFKSIDYAVRSRKVPNDESTPEEDLKPLPPHATRPDGARKWVNLHRAAIGKRSFSKEEWAVVSAAQQQQQQPSRVRAMMLDERAL